MEFEHAADDHRDQGLLHLDPVAGDVTIKAVLAIELVEVRVPGAGALVEPPGHVELLVEGVEGVPVVRMPVVGVAEVGAGEGPDGAEGPEGPHALAAGPT